MEFDLTEEQKQVKQSVREFAEAEIAPHVMEWDESQHFPMDLLPKLAWHLDEPFAHAGIVFVSRRDVSPGGTDHFFVDGMTFEATRFFRQLQDRPDAAHERSSV